MCEPIAATAIVASAATAIGNYAQIKAQNAQAKAEMKAAKNAALYDTLALEMRRHQINQSTDLEIFERQRQALRERSRIAVAAGEAGVAGNSPARMIAQSILDASFDIGVRQSNRESNLLQTKLDEEAVKATKTYRVNTARSQMINPFMGALMIGGRTASTYYNTPRISS